MVENNPSEMNKHFWGKWLQTCYQTKKGSIISSLKTSIAHTCTCSFINELNITEMFCCHQMPKMGIEVIICMHFSFHATTRKLVAQESDSLWFQQLNLLFQTKNQSQAGVRGTEIDACILLLSGADTTLKKTPKETSLREFAITMHCSSCSLNKVGPIVECANSGYFKVGENAGTFQGLW